MFRCPHLDLFVPRLSSRSVCHIVVVLFLSGERDGPLHYLDSSKAPTPASRYGGVGYYSLYHPSNHSGSVTPLSCYSHPFEMMHIESLREKLNRLTRDKGSVPVWCVQHENEWLLLCVWPRIVVFHFPSVLRFYPCCFSLSSRSRWSVNKTSPCRRSRRRTTDTLGYGCVLCLELAPHCSDWIRRDSLSDLIDSLRRAAGSSREETTAFANENIQLS